MRKIEKLIDENHTSNTTYEYTLAVLQTLYKNKGLDFNTFLAENYSYIDYTNLDLENLICLKSFYLLSDSKLKSYLQRKNIKDRQK